MTTATTSLSPSDIDQTDARLLACMSQINEVLKTNGLEGKIGLEILHNHFPVSRDEIMFESVDAATRTVTFRPLQRASLDPRESFVSVWDPSTADPVKRCPRTDSCHQILR